MNTNVKPVNVNSWMSQFIIGVALLVVGAILTGTDLADIGFFVGLLGVGLTLMSFVKRDRDYTEVRQAAQMQHVSWQLEQIRQQTGPNQHQQH